MPWGISVRGSVFGQLRRIGLQVGEILFLAPQQAYRRPVMSKRFPKSSSLVRDLINPSGSTVDQTSREAGFVSYVKS